LDTCMTCTPTFFVLAPHMLRLPAMCSASLSASCSLVLLLRTTRTTTDKTWAEPVSAGRASLNWSHQYDHQSQLQARSGQI
jgi:hypothetical protein